MAGDQKTGEKQTQNERTRRKEKRVLPRGLLQRKIIIKQAEKGRCDDKRTRKLQEENNSNFVKEGRVRRGLCLLMQAIRLSRAELKSIRGSWY